jgi:hypothetical protein
MQADQTPSEQVRQPASHPLVPEAHGMKPPSEPHGSPAVTFSGQTPLPSHLTVVIGTQRLVCGWQS